VTLRLFVTAVMGSSFRRETSNKRSQAKMENYPSRGTVVGVRLSGFNKLMQAVSVDPSW
jgi:hypothetical protein